MPLLKKSFKGSLPQTNNSKFKVPFLHKKINIKDFIKDTSKNPTPRKPYKDFEETVSQHNGRSSSPASLTKHHEQNENVDAKSTKIHGKSKDINKTEYKLEKKIKKKPSREELNEDGTRSDTYIGLVNDSSKENGVTKRNFLIYSSSEDLFDELKSLSQSSLTSVHPKNSPCQDVNSNYKNTEKINNSSFQNNLSGEKFQDKIMNKENRKEKSPGNSQNKIVEKAAKISAEEKAKKRKRNQSEKRKENAEVSTSSSLSQEELNSEDIKAAYVDFMNKLLAEENKNNDSCKTAEDVKILPQNKRFKASSKENVPKSSPSKKKNDKQLKNKTSKSKSRKESSPKKKSEEEYSSEEFAGLTLEKKMDEIYKWRNVGLYVYCDSCNKARYLPHLVDPLDLPDNWYCFMNPDKKHNKCSDPELVTESEDFLINNLYNAGSVIFVKMNGYPWWPGMVDDCPDTETYFWLEGDSSAPSYYHVTFFDSAEVSRAWIKTPMTKPFKKNMENQYAQISKQKKYKSRLIAAFKQAEDASNLPLIERLKKFGFICRYKKPLKQAKLPKEKKLKPAKQPKNKKGKSSSLDAEMSAILTDINLSDISFNFLD